MEYKTSDIYLATALLTVGHPVLRIDNTNEKRKQFCFKSSPQINHDIDRFWGKDLFVEPQTLLGNLKTLKNRIYNV